MFHRQVIGRGSSSISRRGEAFARLSLSPSIYIDLLYLYLSISISLYLYLSISIYVYLYLSISISICICISLHLYISICLHIYLHIYILYVQRWHGSFAVSACCGEASCAAVFASSRRWWTRVIRRPPRRALPWSPWSVPPGKSAPVLLVAGRARFAALRSGGHQDHEAPGRPS